MKQNKGKWFSPREMMVNISYPARNKNLRKMAKFMVLDTREIKMPRYRIRQYRY